MSAGILYLIYELFDGPWITKTVPPMLRFLGAVIAICILAAIFIPRLPYYSVSHPKPQNTTITHAPKGNELQPAPEINTKRSDTLPKQRKAEHKPASPEEKPQQSPPPPVPQHLYDLTGDRRAKFLELLKVPPDGQRDTIRIGCTGWSESSCVAAGKFLILFSEAGWAIDSDKVYRLEPSIPIDGIAIIARPDKAEIGDKLPPHLGRWHKMDPSHVRIYSAFSMMGIPVSGSSDPEMPIGTLGVYFGPEPQR